MTITVEKLRRWSTARLKARKVGLERAECCCDPYNGFTCGKHNLQSMIHSVLERRFLDSFRAQLLFTATERLTAHLERKRKERAYRVHVYRLPDGTYDISRNNKDHSLKEPFALAEYSCGCWSILGRG